MQRTARLLAFLLSNTAVAVPFFAQQESQDTLIVSQLKPVTVSAYRLETSDLTTPLSITTIGQRQLQTGTQQLALDEALAGVPGLFVQNGTNFAQDIRVSIRGFGARSAFGIRGVKILVDGFPESTPDGTAQVDAVDPGSLTGVTVIRSGTGGLYGNASGGSINFSTMRFNDEEWAEVGATFGQYGFQKYQIRTGGGKANKFLYSINSSYTTSDGYRDHSGMKNYLVNGGFLVPIDSTLVLRGVVTYANSPLGQDPGALTQAQVDLDRTMARETNLQFDADEKLWQLRTGIGISKKFNQKHSVNGNIYHADRSFQARLPFDYVELERSFTGGTFSHGFKSRFWEVTTGIDLEDQTDDRKRYTNQSGKRGDLYADQKESFRSIGLFVVQKIELGKRILVLPSLRYDRVAIGIEDHFLLDNSNDSFLQRYKVFNPTIGLSFLASPNVNFYLNGGSNFETPTILEVTSSAEVNGNFNYDLVPQKSRSLEIGTKILSANGQVRAEIALYRIWLNDEFISFQNTAGASYFENAGRSKRKGLELSLSGQLAKYLLFRANYTYSDFEFVEFRTFNGKKLPGAPVHQGGGELQFAKPIGLFFTLGSQYVSGLFLNNANEGKANPYLNGYGRAGWAIQKSKFRTELFVGINNLYNSNYNSNIRINSGSNYFEPAPPRNYYTGVKFRI